MRFATDCRGSLSGRGLRDASLVSLEVALALAAREGGPDDMGSRFCCCSKRPMRFATDCRGRLSGRGLR